MKDVVALQVACPLETSFDGCTSLDKVIELYTAKNFTGLC
jgi:hypothetical protein